MHEFERIATYFAPLAHPDYSLNLKDDAALLSVPAGKQLAITTDTLNETIHFIGNESPDLIARKALRVNLSDLAAMGATPLAYTLNLALPKDIPESFLVSFVRGLSVDQEQFGIHLIGGDSTSSNGGISITITAYGLVDTGRALKRNGAQLGDAIYVTGSIGEAALGLEVAQGKRASTEWLNRYQLPDPRLDIAAQLIGKATACMDISDGLLQDVEQLCNASGVGAKINLDAIPIADSHVRDLCLSGGDDYQLLFTAPAGLELADCTCIGVIADGEVEYLDSDGKAVTFNRKGYQHF